MAHRSDLQHDLVNTGGAHGRHGGGRSLDADQSILDGRNERRQLQHLQKRLTYQIRDYNRHDGFRVDGQHHLFLCRIGIGCGGQ